MNPNTTKSALGGLLPLITTPTGLAILGIGAAGALILGLFSEEKEETGNGSKTVGNGSKPSRQSLEAIPATAHSTAREPLETVDVTVAQAAAAPVQESFPVPAEEALSKDPKQTSKLSLADKKKGMIRQAMSELGKRSGAARRHKSKKFNASNK